MTSVLESLNSGLHHSLAENDHVILLGEDILDPYGGAFKVTRGLSAAFPNQVLTTPVSEAGIIGLGAGLALRGFRPVVEIMFGDFTTLAADQLINHAAKFRWMYNDQAHVPLVVRTPMGGGRGYGPTHSQSLEKMFMGIPGLQVLAPSAFGNPGGLLSQAILNTQNPLLFVEHKLLYQLPIQGLGDDPDFVIEEVQHQTSPDKLTTPTYVLRIRDGAVPALTTAAYGYCAELVRKAALRLAYEKEIFVEIVIMTDLSSENCAEVIQSCQRTRRLLTVEEGSMEHGWGSEVLSKTAEKMVCSLKSAARLGALNFPIPASRPLETAVLPDPEKIYLKCLEIIESS